MDLILSLIKKFTSCPEAITLDLENYHKDTEKVNKMAKKMFRSLYLDVEDKLCGYIIHNYKCEEDAVEMNSIVNFGILTESAEFANTMALIIKAIRVYSLYYQFEDRDICEGGITEKQQEFICKHLKEAEQLLIVLVLKYFKDKNKLIEWNKGEFNCCNHLTTNELKIINCVCQVLQHCRMLKDSISCNIAIDSLQLCNKLNFDTIFENRSTHLFYY